jgi:penicillin-binding protein 1A
MTARARRRHRRSRNGSVGKKVLLGIAALLGAVALVLAGIGFWVQDILASAPSINRLQPIDQGETSFVYAADGSELGAIQADTVRTPVPLRQVPRALQHATVAIEDEHFYTHSGVDYSAILRAAWENFQAGKTIQGGSTITQQLARNLYIPDPEQDIERKLVEAKLATELEDEHSKRWILAQYLNTSPYGTNEGRTAVGVEAAAQTYFAKHVSDLNLSQSALLAGLPQAPSEYNPFSSPDQAIARRNEVLKAMFQQGYISRAEEQKALANGLGLSHGTKYTTVRQPYFFDYVQQELIDRYGVNTVRQGGLRVYTTINPRLQAIAQAAVNNGSASLAGLATYGAPSQALVSIDPANGHIVAMASSGSYDSRQFNLAAQGHRQPGSSFKPFVLTTALKQGIDPDTTYYDGTSPVSIQLGQYSPPWVVNNAEEGGGTMNITSATTNSVNAVYAQLDVDVGPENVAQTAHQLGITSPLDGFPAEGIGGLRIGVSPLEMADAYATFASGGIHHDATAIARVVFPNGKVDEPDEDAGQRVISDGVAYEVTRILKTVLTEGTAGGQGLPGCPAAGKTGTTDEQTDAWFVGYTTTLSTAVWTGYPDSRLTMGGSAFGGVFSAPTWHDFMSQATPTCGDFPTPTSLPDLTTFYSDHTVSPKSQTYGGETGTSTTTTPGDTTASPDEAQGLQGPSDAYAPGIQGNPGNGGGNANGGGGGGHP